VQAQLNRVDVFEDLSRPEVLRESINVPPAGRPSASARVRWERPPALTIVMAALAVPRLVEAGADLEQSTSWSIGRFVKTLRRYHTVTIQAGNKIITAADPLPDDALRALTRLRAATAAH
jgi:hypothetical protein